MAAERKWTRNKRLAAIVAERNLSTRGFRRSLRALVKEFVPEAEERDFEFEEWFDDCPVVPAAYRILREEGNRGIYGVTVEVYEVENTAEIPEWKLSYYGDVADGEGPLLDLHILDKYDHEIVVECEDLMCFAFMHSWSKEDKKEQLKWMRSQAKVQHHAPVVIDNERLAERQREIRTLKRQLVKADYSQIADVLQEIIYGLGLQRSHKDIAERANVEPAVVRATARLLAAGDVNPKEIVKNAHARWKAAYDAVRELGIQL